MNSLLTVAFAFHSIKNVDFFLLSHAAANLSNLLYFNYPFQLILDHVIVFLPLFIVNEMRSLLAKFVTIQKLNLSSLKPHRTIVVSKIYFQLFNSKCVNESFRI